MENFLGISRDVLKHWVYSDIYAWRVWSHILFSAQFAKKENSVKINGYWVTQNYGEFIFGRDSWSESLQVPAQRLRTIMKAFEKEGMIKNTNQQHARCTVYLVTNYEKFNQRINQQKSLEPQAFEDTPNQLSNQQPTSSQPAANQQPTTIKKVNTVKTVKKPIVGTDLVDNVLGHLNRVMGTKYNSKSKQNITLIEFLGKIGYTEQDMIAVIDSKYDEWNRKTQEAYDGKVWLVYMRPSTLFRGSNFENYIEQARVSGYIKAEPEQPTKQEEEPKREFQTEEGLAEWREKMAGLLAGASVFKGVIKCG